MIADERMFHLNVNSIIGVSAGHPVDDVYSPEIKRVNSPSGMVSTSVSN